MNSPHADQGTLGQILSHSPIPAWLCDAQTLGFHKVNRAAILEYGYTRDEYASMRLDQVIPWEELAPILDHLRRPEPEHPRIHLCRHCTKDQRFIHTETSCQLFHTQEGSRLLVTARDVSAHRTTQADLQRIETQYQLLTEHAMDLISIYDVDGRITYMNSRALALTGYTKEDLAWLTVTDLAPPERVDDFRQLSRQRREGDESQYLYETELLSRTGRRIPVEVSSNTVSSDNGTRYTLVVSRDISDRRRTEARVRRLNRILTVMSGINQAIVRIRKPADLLQEACRIAVEHGGFRTALIISFHVGRSQTTLTAHAGFNSDYLQELLRLVNSGILEDQNGTRRILSASHIVVNDIASDPQAIPWREPALAGGYHSVATFPLRVFEEVQAIFCVFAHESGFFNDEELNLLDELAMDLSYAMEFAQSEEERLRAEEELRQSRQRLALAQRAAGFGTWELDIPSGHVTWDASMYELLEVSPDEFDGAFDGWLRVVHPDDRPHVQEAATRAIVDGTPYHVTYRFVTGPGRERHVESQATVLWDEQGTPLRMIGLCRDISAQVRMAAEKQELERQFQQAQRLESLGRLAGGIAHDFNNLLVPILGYAELGLINGQGTEKLPAYLTRIKEAADRASNLTRQILAFSRQQILETRPLDLNESIRNFQSMVERVIGEDVDLTTNLAPGLPWVEVDPGQIEQVLMNLAVNARDAMPEGGALAISTGIEAVDRASDRHRHAPAPGRYVVISVSDSGQGMDGDTLERIFEPFFTTKEQGKGTGLGLSTVFGIVVQHGGYIDVQSQPGSGTTVQVYLPAIAPIPADEDAVQEETRLDGAGTVLLVEDDPNVRRLVEETLREHGYHVLVAQHAEEALTMSREHAGAIDLLLSDVIMPGMGGGELARRLAADRPETKILFMSGYTADRLVKHGITHESAAFIRKPFSILNLLKAVQRAMGRMPPD